MYQRILVPIDGSGTSNRALAAALDLAKTLGGRVRLVHVMSESAYLTGYDPYGGSGAAMYEAVRKAADQIVADGARIAAAAGVEADSIMVDKSGERLGETIANAVKLWSADLVVVGTHGRRGLGRVLLGSGAEQIIRDAPVPVLVIRSREEDESPKA
jgi:nucleotide-binding universal stress UspA family protein